MSLIAAASLSEVRVDPAKGWVIRTALSGRELSGVRICARVDTHVCSYLCSYPCSADWCTSLCCMRQE